VIYIRAFIFLAFMTFLYFLKHLKSSPLFWHRHRAFLTCYFDPFFRFFHLHNRKKVNCEITDVIESGLITFVGQLAQSIMYKSATAAFPLVGGCVVMLYVSLLVDCRFSVVISSTSKGISTTVVLVRVQMGITYNHNASMTAYYP
jgi:hypothetical protein